MSGHAAATDGSASGAIGLVIALPAEARSLGVHATRSGDCVRWQRGWAAVSGIGPHNAMHAAERLLACGVTALANWGVAGALDATLRAGDILIPDRVLYSHGDPGFATDPTATRRLADVLGASLQIRRGALWSVPQPLASPADKAGLAAQSGALAVDMEAAPIAAVAARARIPFLAVKAICDPVTREVPERIARTLGDGGMSWRMLAAIAFGGPRTWRAVNALSHDFASARRALSTAARLANA